MPTRVLLSVKPRFAEAILAGEKTFEFRRAVFRRQDIETVVLYASSPTCKVVGEFTIDKVLSLAPRCAVESHAHWRRDRSRVLQSVLSRGERRDMPSR